ncbi:MAG: VWA domain-containing protein [Bryobacteraceae bacterium]|jgi:VWFA-related protein
MRAPRRSALFLLLCSPLLAQTGGSSGAKTASVTLAPEVQPVLVDAVVTGEKDEPIHGLTEKDFHLLQDGKEQAITGFQTHGGSAAPGLSRQQHVALLIGAQSDGDRKWIQQAAAKFVAGNAGPNRLMAVIYTDACYNTISTPFTADANQLQHALDAWPDLVHCDGAPDPDGNLRPLYYAQVAKGLGQVLGHKAVALLVANLAPSAAAEGRKAPEPVAATRKVRARSGGNAEPHQDPFDMELEFRKADVSVYPAEAQAGVPAPAWALDLAEATGGHELSRGSDGLGVFDPLAREQDETYTLAYVPRLSAEGSCHPLKVTVNQPGVTVRGRNLYCNVRQAGPVVAAKPKENELEVLAASAGAGNTEASASVPFFYDPSGVARVTMALEIPSPVLDPTDLNGKLHAEIEVLGMAYSPGGGVAARFTHKLKFDFDSRRQLDDFLRHPIHYERQFEVAPGNYRFKVVFRSAKDRFGVVEAPLAIDPFNAGQLSLSAIALSRDVQPISQEAAQDEAEKGKNPLIYRGNRIAISGSDVLSKTGTAEAYFEVYEPFASGAGAVQLTMRLRLLDAQTNQPAWNSGDIDLSALAKSSNRVIPVALKLPVANLPPGTYRAELIVKDSAGGQAARSMEFRME